MTESGAMTSSSKFGWAGSGLGKSGGTRSSARGTWALGSTDGTAIEGVGPWTSDGMGTLLWAARSELGSGWGMPVFGARGPAGFAVLGGADASGRLATGAGVLGGAG